MSETELPSWGPVETEGPALVAHLRRMAEGRTLHIHDFVAPTRKRVRAASLDISYLDWGNEAAPPLLLLHAGRLHAHSWDLVCLALREQYHCIVPDLPGHGDSGWFAGGSYDFNHNADELEPFLAALGIDRFRMVGISYGGFIALALAARIPQRLIKLVTMDITPFINRTGVIRQLSEMADFEPKPHFEDFVRLALSERKVRDIDRLRFSLSQNMRQLPDGRWAWKYDTRPRTTNTYEVLASQHQGVAERLHLVTCPTLVLRGEHSDLVSPEGLAAMAALLPDAHMGEIAAARHLLHHENPNAVIERLREFLGPLEG